MNAPIRKTILGYGKTFLGSEKDADPKMEVVVAPVNEQHKANIDAATPLVINITDLTNFKPGSIFEESPKWSKNTSRFNTRNFSFNTSACSVKRLGEIAEAEHWFKRTKNPYFHQLKVMHVVTGKTSTHKKFIVPCPVVALYYLPHTKLLKAALSGKPLEKNDDLFNPSLTQWNNQPPNIHLPYNVTTQIAPFIAFYILDKEAGKAFHQIHSRSLVANPSDYYKDPSFYMELPVKGEPTWKIKCFETHNVIWVTQILDCNSLAPFKGLVITKPKQERIGPTYIKRVDKPRQQARADDENLIFVPGSKTDIHLETVELKDPSQEVTYSGFDQAKIKLVQKIHYRLENKTIITTDKPLLPLLLGTGSASPDGKGVTPVEHSAAENMSYEQADEETKAPPNIQSLFEAAIQNLSALYENLALIQLSNAIPQTPPLNANLLPYSEEANRTPWCRKYLVKGRPDEIKAQWEFSARRFYIARLIHEQHCLYIVGFILFETQSDNSAILAFGNAKSHTEQHTLREILEYAASRSKWPLPLHESMVVFKYREKKHHPFTRDGEEGNQPKSEKQIHLMMNKLNGIIEEFIKSVEEKNPKDSDR